MTKKDLGVFSKIIGMNNAADTAFLGIIEQNGFYYAFNKYMAVRTAEKPELGMVPEKYQRADTYERLEQHFEDVFSEDSCLVALPTKSEIISLRKKLTAEEKREKPYLLTSTNDMLIAVNNSYLSLFLDLFGIADCSCYARSPVKALYFINRKNGIEGILFPIYITDYTKAMNAKVRD